MTKIRITQEEMDRNYRESGGLPEVPNQGKGLFFKQGGGDDRTIRNGFGYKEGGGDDSTIRNGVGYAAGANDGTSGSKEH